jgi:hypothetical protein
MMIVVQAAVAAIICSAGVWFIREDRRRCRVNRVRIRAMKARTDELLARCELSLAAARGELAREGKPPA